MSIYAPARIALRTVLETFVTNNPNFPKGVAWEGRTFDPDVSKAYIRETLKEGQSRRMSIGPNAFIRHSALYLLDTFTPKREGSEGSDKRGDVIQELYWPGLQVVNAGLVVTIISSSQMPVVLDANWRMKPVTIAFKFDTLTPL